MAHRDRPVTTEDRKMSVKHAMDSIKFNERHARDHMKLAKKAKARLSAVRHVRVRAI